jgi:hypothetical protein
MMPNRPRYVDPKMELGLKTRYAWKMIATDGLSLFELIKTSSDSLKTGLALAHAELLVAHAVLTNRSARRQIPVDREKNREFFVFRAFRPKFIAKSATDQPFAAKSLRIRIGNLFLRTGNSESIVSGISILAPL